MTTFVMTDAVEWLEDFSEHDMRGESNFARWNGFIGHMAQIKDDHGWSEERCSYCQLDEEIPGFRFGDDQHDMEAWG